jgi:hypothetical protein
MSRSRFVVLASFLVVGLGVVAAVGALYLDPARAAVGPLPAEGLALPANSQFVMGFDVQRVVSSPFYKRQAALVSANRPKAFVELQEKTGIDPERDLDLVVVAGGRDSGVVLVRGRFDHYKLARSIETSKKGVTTKKHEGVSMYLHDEGKRYATAVAFVGDDMVVLGSQPGVEATLTSHAQGAGGLKANAALMALLQGLKPGSTFWMVGDQSLLSQLPSSMPHLGAGGDAQGPRAASLGLPPLKSVVATGDLEPDVSIDLTAEAGSDADARNLADVVRGLVAMASLQSGQKPELKGLTSAISVTTEAQRVRLTARLPYTLLEALQPKPMPKAAPSPGSGPRHP